MDTIQLRKLTKKSVLWFGQYKDLSIQQVLTNNHQQYLRWIYYNYEGITFTDDILKEIRIPFSIQKPGNYKEFSANIAKNGLAYSIKQAYQEYSLTGNVDKVIKVNAGISRTKKTDLAKLCNYKRYDTVKYSRANLTRLNQGHF